MNERIDRKKIILWIAIFLLFSLMVTNVYAGLSIDKLNEQLNANTSELDISREKLVQLRTTNLNQSDLEKSLQDKINTLIADITLDCKNLLSLTSEYGEQTIYCTDFLAANNPANEAAFSFDKSQSESSDDLDAQFTKSLGEFDETLLREQARVKAAKPYLHGPDGGKEHGDQQSPSGSEGENQQTSNEQAQSDEDMGEGSESAQSEDGESHNSQQSPDDNNSVAGSSENDKNSDSGGFDSRDDDIVARQLREAAQKEKDPELKKKLWEEYRKYRRQNTSTSGGG